jgi:hypothetical protein
MEVKAVIDRFEGDKAVILVGDEEEQLVVDRTKLPESAKEGDWLVADVQDDVLLAATLNPQETANAQARISAKLEALRRGDQLR